MKRKMELKRMPTAPHIHTSRAIVLLTLFAGILSSASFGPPCHRRRRASRPATRRRLSPGGGDGGDDGAAPDASPHAGLRLNKVFKATHSRREADRLVASGRVRVNGAVPAAGDRVVPFRDAVTLDGVAVEGWEALNGVDADGRDGETT